MAGNKRGSASRVLGYAIRAAATADADLCLITRVRRAADRGAILRAPVRTLRQLRPDGTPRKGDLDPAARAGIRPLRSGRRADPPPSGRSPAPGPYRRRCPAVRRGTPPRLNRSKTRCRSDSRNAGPLVQDLQVQRLRAAAPRRARTVTRPCGGLCLTALSIRFATTWCIRSGSACAVSSGGDTSRCRWTSVRVWLPEPEAMPARAEATMLASFSTPDRYGHTSKRAPAQRYDAVVQPGQVQQRLHQPARAAPSASGPCASSPGRPRRRRPRRSPGPRAAPRWGCAARARRSPPAPCAAGPAASRSSAMRLIVWARSPSSSRRSVAHPAGVVAVRDRPGHRGHLVQRRGERVRHELRDQQCGDHREDRDEAELGPGAHRHHRADRW